jgi:hypothetical protein
LNPHASRRHPLKMVCLPISPLPQSVKLLPSGKYSKEEPPVLRRDHSQKVSFPGVLVKREAARNRSSCYALSVKERPILALFCVFLCAARLGAQQTSPQQTSLTTDVPAGSRLVLEAKGDGVQIYGCTAGSWTLVGPDAKLLDGQGRTIGAHFAGPTWRLNDGSQVRGKMIASQPSPESGAVPWLLLESVPGSGSGRFAKVAFIRRTETHGGAAPKGPCAGALRIRYTASYSFYEK